MENQEPWTLEQAYELVKQYGLQDIDDGLKRLVTLVGGHPYLLQQAFYALRSKQVSIEDLLINAPTLSGIYRGYFQDVSVKLHSTKGQSVDLVEAFQQMLHHPETTKLSLEEVFKLEGLGVVQMRQNPVSVSCELCQKFFQDWL